MNVKRKLALVTATLSVAFGAGHLMQGRLSGKAAADPAMMAAAVASPVPTGITPMAGTIETKAKPLVMPPLPAPPDAPFAGPAPAVDRKQPPQPAVVAETEKTCDPSLDLLARPNAMVSVVLTAPCNANERVVVRHAGLAFTARTSTEGGLALTIPALEQVAALSVLFPSGRKVEAEVQLPAIDDLRRFGVQWMAADSFQVHAFERGASYGEPGHVFAANPAMPDADGGWLTVLGDASVDLPMLAEVYTYPRKGTVAVVVEAAVTAATCGRELLADTINSIGGEVFVTDLSVAMPDCAAVGDIIVLKDLVLDPKIAAAN